MSRKERDILPDKEQFEFIRDGLLTRAPAKINLSLLIASKRPDGFHEIETLMAKINLYDEILFERSNSGRIELLCEGSHPVPTGTENIVYKACRLFLNRASLSSKIKATLTKNIPVGAGLGGGSSDAAATLMGLNKFLKTGFSQQQLFEMASELGSDVPFFIGGPLAYCTGRGEKIRKIEKKHPFLAVLILPNVNVSTKRVYGNYTHDKNIYKTLKDTIYSHLKKNRVDLVAQMCANMLENSCFAMHRRLSQLKAKIEKLGVAPICLSGSGSAMFHIIECADYQLAKEYRAGLSSLSECESVVVKNSMW
jgi:4-diphosphocytidyl-2-C-methyl-D-erythritol kinase